MVEPIVTPCVSDNFRISSMGPAQSILEARTKVRRGTRNADSCQMFHDAGRCYLAGMMPAHAIGNQPEAAAGVDQVVIFIGETYAALVAYAVAFEGENNIVQLRTALPGRPSAAQSSAPAHASLPQVRALEYQK